MRASKKILIAIKYTMLFTSLIFTCSCMGYVEYVPIVLIVEHGDHILREEPSLITPEHIKAMKIILERYGEKYNMKDGKLYIKQSLQNDRDLLQNYTFKAESEITEAKEVAESLVKEVALVETQQSGKASDITKLAILISAALNIANENFELKRNYSELLQKLSERSASLIRTLSANMQ